MANFTKKAILQTFDRMLEEMPFDRITVSALTRECEISHNTFYYHYQDIFDLLDAWLEEELGEHVFDISPDTGQEAIRNLLCACREKKKTVYHIFNGLSRDNLERYTFVTTDRVFLPYIQKLSEGQDVPEEYLLDVAAFCRYSFLGFFLEFLWNNMADDIDALSAKLYGLLSDFVTHALEK